MVPQRKLFRMSLGFVHFNVCGKSYSKLELNLRRRRGYKCQQNNYKKLYRSAASFLGHIFAHFIPDTIDHGIDFGHIHPLDNLSQKKNPDFEQPEEQGHRVSKNSNRSARGRDRREKISPIREGRIRPIADEQLGL